MTTTNQAVTPPQGSTDQHNPSEIISTEQLSQEWDVPVQTLYAWRYKGTGPPSCRVGKYVRYRRRDLDAWLEAQVAAGRPGAA